MVKAVQGAVEGYIVVVDAKYMSDVRPLAVAPMPPFAFLIASRPNRQWCNTRKWSFTFFMAGLQGNFFDCGVYLATLRASVLLVSRVECISLDKRRNDAWGMGARFTMTIVFARELLYFFGFPFWLLHGHIIIFDLTDRLADNKTSLSDRLF